MTPNSSSTRKSHRLQDRTPPTPVVGRKPERVEKQNMPSPMRRSGKTGSYSSLIHSDSKSSGSSSSKQNPENEKSVKRLTFGDKDKNEEYGSGTSHTEKRRMDARQYRSLFRKPNNGCVTDHLEPNKINKSTQEGGNISGGKIDECSKGNCFNCKEVSKTCMLPSENDKANKMRADTGLSGTMKSPAENNLPEDLMVPSNATTSETSVVPQMAQPDSSGDERLRKLESSNSLLDEDLVRGHDIGETLIPSKSNGTIVDMVSDVSATSANEVDYNLIPSSPGGYIVGTGSSCSKRKRLDCDPTVSCNASRNPSANELQDGGDIDASMLEKECHANSQTKVAKKICLICKSDEQQLLFCGGKGCGGCYHLYCLEPPLVDAPIGIWHCHFCVRKKITLGVYSVSEGVESVCDVKEVSPSKVDGTATQKEFLVKYKGLAHVHNQWIPEKQLLLDAPSLIMNFNMKNQTQRLKPEWSLPHRLLQKRAIICSTEHDDHRTNHSIDNFDCCYEWLVKWRGLGYECVTWELDNAPFLRSLEGQSLIHGFEERFQRAKRVSSCSKSDKKPARGNSVSKLSQMPGGVSSGVGSNNLDAVNKLREHWYQSQNAIVIDDQDRILKVVAFILSLCSDTYRPFLIITTAASLHSWEDEFYRLDPSIDVFIYSGNKEIRHSIRRIEFCDGGCALFQVLVVVPEILIEDVDVLGGIEWEAIIVDECQSPKVSPYFENFKILNAHLRVLLFHGQLKDSVAEYTNILALLDSHCDVENDDLIPDSSNNIDQLKEKLSSYIAYRCKSDLTRFVEYWVPAQMSYLQLEQYCATLHSNASILRSSLKKDTVEALHEVLIRTRKCCSHPYTVDQSLKNLLIMGLKETEYLDVDIKASGKLQLLDSLLMVLREKNLRGLILFQSFGGSGRVSMGDYLDDFLRQRFGEDSYERVDKSLALFKKRDAMRKFNNKDNGRFVFLLETIACCSSIKLSYVDTIIIFDSDWNPMNDRRSLQKLTLDSHSELVKIFRLYSSSTVEENALILAKKEKIIDSNLQNISRNTFHMLFMWGASSLFDDLKVFQDGKTSLSSLNSASGLQLLTKTVHEFSFILSQDGEDNDSSSCLILLKVQQNGGTYHADFSLPGELKLRLLDEEPPHIFWTKLLEDKQFYWKYSHSTSQRSRKRVNHFDGSVKNAELVSEAVVTKKRRKVSNNIVEQTSSKSEGAIKTGTSGDSADRSQCNDVESETKTTLDEQRSLHLKLKPEITKLCEVLLLPDHVKILVDNFLEYVMNNHHVNNEPVSLVQAFQISLIWTAAAMLKYKLDHKASLLQAKQHLNFDCKKEEVDYIYSMLRCLKRIFLYRTGSSNDTYSPKASESKRIYSNTEVAQEVELFRKDLYKSIKDIRKKCEKPLKKLSLLHQEEKQRLEKAFEGEMAGIERTYKLELAIIRSFSPSDVMRTEKLKVLKSEHGKKIEELKLQHETRLKALEDEQLAERKKFKDREDTWVEDLNSWAQNELRNNVGMRFEYLLSCDQEQPQNCSKNVTHVSNNFSEGNDHNNVVPEVNSPAVVLCSTPLELQTPLIKHTAADEIGNMVSEDRPHFRSDGHNIFANQNDSLGNIITKSSHSRKQNFVVATAMTDKGDGCGDDTVSLALSPSNVESCVDKLGVPSGEVTPLSNERIADGIIVSILDREEPVGMPGTVNIIDCPENSNDVNPPSSVEQVPDGGALDEVLNRELSRPCGTVTPSNDPDINARPSTPLEKQISDGVSLSIYHGDAPLIMPENRHEVADNLNCTLLSADAVLVEKSTSDQQEGVSKTVMECTTSDQQEGVPRSQIVCTSSQENPVSRPVDVMEPPEQAQKLPSVELPPDQDAPGELQDSSQRVELVSGRDVVLPANQSNQDSLIMEPSEQVQQLPSSEHPSSYQTHNLIPVTGVEHQSTNNLPRHVVHSEVDSHLHSLRPVGVRTEPSNTRNLLTPSNINNPPAQTASQLASRMLPLMSPDPLKNELERIRSSAEQLVKKHEDTKSRFKSDFEKEVKALRRNYDTKIQENEIQFQQTKKNLDASFRTVVANKILADAFRSKCTDRKTSDADGMQPDAFVQLLARRQQSATRPSHVAGAPRAPSMWSPSTAARSPNMLSPTQAVYNTYGVFSNISPRLPLLNHSIPLPSGNLQVGGQIRAPLPHLQHRPSTSMPAPVHPHRMPSQPAHNYIPAATSPSLAQRPPQPNPMMIRSDPQMCLRPDSASGHPTINLPAMDSRANANSQSTTNLPNVLASMLDAVSLNPTRFDTNGSVLPNSSNQAASSDVVCISDDDS